MKLSPGAAGVNPARPGNAEFCTLQAKPSLLSAKPGPALAGVEVVGPAKQNNGLHRQTASQASIEVKQLFPQVANPHGEPLPLVAAARERDRRAPENDFRAIRTSSSAVARLRGSGP